jgi:predicted AAA+ superfamily ATPase
MVRKLQPYHVNLKKRQVKSPKIYVRDSGLLHQLLGIDSMKSPYSHPKVGASWQGFVIEQMLMMESYDEVFFWATHQGAEIDLILRRGNALYGIECKRADTSSLTPSIMMNHDRILRLIVRRRFSAIMARMPCDLVKSSGPCQ